jgi:uncharacterized 2Fe-2S/4Fe-4S cluster protein (DUF4445 family)
MSKTEHATYWIVFTPSGRRGQITSGTTLLEAARQLGVGIESICGGRMTCNKCLVQVESGPLGRTGGSDALRRSSPAHLSPPQPDEARLLQTLALDNGRLACQAKIQGDLLIYVPEDSRAQKQIIRKAASEHTIPINPAIRQLYVAVAPAALRQHHDDWARLQAGLRQQWQLDGLTIDLPALRHLQTALRQGDWHVTVTLWQEREVIDVQPGYTEGMYGLAVDVGTTTLAAYLCDLRTGAILATESAMNPQVTYGEDLMSRISYANEHPQGVNKLHTAAIDALNKLAAQAARAAKIRPQQIYDVVCVGNTTMTHLLLGVSPTELGQTPFALAWREGFDARARDLGLRLHPGAKLHLLPAQAGHVGADNVAVLLAEVPHQQDEMLLIVDVGTNAEIVLGNRARLFSASSPTGPAFEGAQIEFGMRAAPGAIERVRLDPVTQEPRFRVIGEERWSDEWDLSPDAPLDRQPAYLAAGLCGSGMIEAVAELVMAGVALPNGRFNPHCSAPRLLKNGPKSAYILATATQSANGRPVLITQKDIRSIQLAKAALYAGAKLLMQRAGVQQVAGVRLAGAFGSLIDPEHALALGLIPDCPPERICAVGNAAGDGARIALLNREARLEAQQIAQQVTYVETASEPQFQEEFANAIHIPHALDDFAWLERRPLAETAVAPTPRPRRQRKA